MKNFYLLKDIIPSGFGTGLFLIQINIIVVSALELFGVLSMLPFINLVLLDSPNNEILIDFIGKYTGIEGKENIIIFLGIFFIISLIISNLLRALLVFFYLNFCEKIGWKITSNLFKYYLDQKYSFILKNDTSNLTNNFIADLPRLISQVIVPLLQINSQIILVVVLFVSLLVINPVSTTIAFLFIGLLYVITFLVTKKTLTQNSISMSINSAIRVRIIKESFGLFKWLKVSGNENILVNEFQGVMKKFHKMIAINNSVALIPRYILEMIALMAVGLICAISYSSVSEFNGLLPQILLLGVAGIKMLPAVQQIFFGVARYQANQSVIRLLHNDISQANLLDTNDFIANKEEIEINKSIRFNEITFSYKGENKVLDKLNIQIFKGTSNAILGESGSGKTTLIDIILGIFKPLSGSIIVDDEKIEIERYVKSFKNISLVPQQIYLLNASIAENIAFGKKIENDKIEKVLKIVDLWNFVYLSCINGIHTDVGENGVNLSGGQKQKIGIARALYEDKDFIILDEATNSIDHKSEERIIENIKSFDNYTIIAISHNIDSYSFCDNIYYIKDGRLKT